MFPPALRLAGWMALAYLGYWSALLLDEVLLRALIYPALGAPLLDWRLTPFRVLLNNGDLGSLAVSPGLRGVLPLLPGIAALTVVLATSGRLRSPGRRVWLHFTALWLVLNLALQAAFLAFLNRGRFAVLLPDEMAGQPVLWRVGLALFLGLALLESAAVLSRWLFRDSIVATGGWKGPRIALLLLVVLPVMLIVCGTFGFRFDRIGLRTTLLLAVPAAFCLLAGARGLWTLRREAGPGNQASAPMATGVSLRRATIALGFAALLFITLGQANRAEALLHERGLASYSSAHYDVRYDPRRFSEDSIRAFAEERERILAHLLGRMRVADNQLDGPAAESLRLRVVLYSDFASKRTATESDRPYNVEGATIRALLHGYIDRLDPAADAAAVLHGLWGPARSPAFGEWTARLLAGEWRRRTVESWAGQIESEVGHYSLAALLSSGPETFVSPLVRTPLGAAWVRYVYDRHGLDAVRRLYSANQPVASLERAAAVLGVAPQRLEADWSAWTTLLKTTNPPAPTQQRLPPEDTFYRGVSFSHEGWGGRRGGYTGPEAQEQLRRLREMGANAIAVVPYGFQREPGDTSISFSFTDETDEELSQALHSAHAFGLRVMLKPQLWVGWGQFTGTIRFDDPALRAHWMRSYREFILHYARLAELQGFDLLCIANELEGMTGYEEDWRGLIAEVRRVYHGPITYAANWGREFETLPFWDALDYAGLNNYYPLLSGEPATAPGEAPHPAELLAGAEKLAARLAALHRKWRRPILFTEVGYPSVRGAARQPWAEDRARGIQLEEQAAIYEAVFQAFHDRPWLRGMFWWKWPSHGRGGGPQDPSYTPLGKPAEGVLRAWYTRIANGTP